jgi:hypothetical protein
MYQMTSNFLPQIGKDAGGCIDGKSFSYKKADLKKKIFFENCFFFLFALLRVLNIFWWEKKHIKGEIGRFQKKFLRCHERL